MISGDLFGGTLNEMCFDSDRRACPENLATSEDIPRPLHHTLREQIRCVSDGLDPMNVIWDERLNRTIPTNAWNTILSSTKASALQGRRLEGCGLLVFWTAITGRAIVDQNERRTRHARQPARHDHLSVNDAFRLGRKIIRECAISQHGGFYGYTRDIVADLDRLFHTLDGKPAPSHLADAANIANRASYDHAKACESEYSGSSSTATATCTSCSSAPTWWRKPTRSSPTTTERCFQTVEDPPPDFLSSAPLFSGSASGPLLLWIGEAGSAKRDRAARRRSPRPSLGDLLQFADTDAPRWESRRPAR
jgi:hypothetical protein